MVPNGQGGWLQPYQSQGAAELEGQPQFQEGEAMDGDVYFIQNIRKNVANVFVDPNPPGVESLRKETGEFAQQVSGAIQETQGQVNALVQGARKGFQNVEARAKENEQALQAWTAEAGKHLDKTALHLQSALQESIILERQNAEQLRAMDEEAHARKNRELHQQLTELQNQIRMMQDNQAMEAQVKQTRELQQRLMAMQNQIQGMQDNQTVEAKRHAQELEILREEHETEREELWEYIHSFRPEVNKTKFPLEENLVGKLAKFPTIVLPTPVRVEAVMVQHKVLLELLPNKE